jgi:ABC-type Na+ efflux pump permease subunit
LIASTQPRPWLSRSLGRFNVWPVVQRELREGARRPVNHRLRLMSAGVGMLVVWLMAASLDEPAAQMGRLFLAGLHTVLLGLIFLIVPALTADCIAREKREGTLGLLFMTPLSARGIVTGKALATGLRTLSLWLSLLPLLTIPFLEGGITWFDALRALSLEFCVAVLCLTAGLLASTLARNRGLAFILAYVLAAGFLFLFSQLFMFAFFVWWRGFAALNTRELWDFVLNSEVLSVFTGLLSVGGGGWTSLAMVYPGLDVIWQRLCWCSPPVTLLFFYAVSSFAAFRIKRSWQDKIPTARREGLLRRYCTPLFRRRFRRKMQRSLDWNPVAWLQQYSWKARVGKWCLLLLFMVVECAMADADESIRSTIRVWLLLILAAGYTFAGVNGFLEEKRSGALELLLVTPVSAGRIIFGRTWGLWWRFLPAGLVLLVFHWQQLWMKNYGGEDVNGDLLMECILVAGFLTLPVFATYFALRVKNLVWATFLTGIALCLPLLFAAVVVQLFAESVETTMVIFSGTILLGNGAFALLAGFLLRHSLSRRIYSF